MDYEALGKNIRTYRKKADLTQAQLAEIIGYSASYIGQIENARTKPSLKAVIDIAKALSVTLNHLLINDIVSPEQIYFAEFTKKIQKFTPAQRIIICNMISIILESISKLLNIFNKR